MKLFVWDFHGVLEKDNEKSVIEISNRVLEKLGYKERFSQENNLKLYGRKWYEYFEFLLPNEPHEKHLEIQQACIKLEEDEPHIVDNNIKPNNYALEVLTTIAKSPHDQILISNMSDVALARFMGAINITHFFPKTKAFPCNTRDGKKTHTKIGMLKKYLRGKSFDSLVIIGDTIFDMEMAKATKDAITYLYVHKYLKFPSATPTYKINDLRKILKEV